MSASIIRQYHDNTEDDDKKINNQHSCEVDKKYLTFGKRWSEITNPDRQLELVPESVKLLLRPLLKSGIKVAF